MSNTYPATLVLLKDERGRICLAPRKKNIHKAGQELKDSNKKWNGYGGKQEPNETILETAIRELKDESGVVGLQDDLELIARISFFWTKKETSTPDMIVYIFFLSIFSGEPKEGVEMGEPQFFFPDEIPYHEMIPADKLFFMKLLAGRKLVGSVYHRLPEEGGPIFEEEPGVYPTL